MLSVLRYTTQDHTYHIVLRALASGIGAACERTKNTTDEAIVDDECERIENLLGVAFVVCQVQIAAVISWARRTCGLQTCKSFAQELLTLGEKVDGGCSYSKIEVIWELGNYFKHRDEWESDWSRLRGRQQKTAKIIQHIGLASGCTGNLRRGAEVLGNRAYVDLHVLADVVDKWGVQVVTEVE
jgi:hypothetical protein